MALALESAGKVRQKTKMYGLSPAIFYILKAFFLYWATNKGNADLQFLPFSAADIVTATGYSPIGAVTSTVHVVYARNSGTGDGTDSWIVLHDASTNTDDAVVMISGVIQDDNDQFIFVNPEGSLFAADLTISAVTAGASETESAEANAADGFVIVSA